MRPKMKNAIAVRDMRDRRRVDRQVWERVHGKGEERENGRRGIEVGVVGVEESRKGSGDADITSGFPCDAAMVRARAA
jgi:hypothetical protein